jgi:3-deoxy-manno-octulosonate cytidylyltransferase (CMP-KDO synthetase)
VHDKLEHIGQSFVDSSAELKLSCYPVNQTGSNLKNNHQKQTVVVIPARFASTRLPGKALLDIAGKPMICRVAERARAARYVDRVIVATDSAEILQAVQLEGFEAVLTSDSHVSGTDRIAEVVESIPEADIIVNLQGDEPLISPHTIEQAVARMKSEQGQADGAGIVTTWEPIDNLENLLNKDCVKVVVGDREQALYFSRSPMPFPREATERHGSPEASLISEPELFKNFRKHTGLYVYRRDVLLKFTQWQPTALEKFEGLEQLRALENGVIIRVIQASTSSIGVDTQQDLERVRDVFRSGEAEAVAVR